MKIHTVKGAAGINLHVREYGKPDGIPILFIHGWSQSYLCWSKQYGSPLANDGALSLSISAVTGCPTPRWRRISTPMATNGPMT